MLGRGKGKITLAAIGTMVLVLVFACAPAHAEGAGIDQTFFEPGGTLDQTAVPGAPAAAGPAPKETPSTLPSLDLASSAIKMLGSLAFVVGLIVLLFKFGKRAKLPFFGGEGIVKRIATEPIGPNQFINVVEIGGRVIVLGTSEKNITMITELSGDALDQVRLARSTQRPLRPESVREGFSSILHSMNALVRGKAENPDAGYMPPREACANSLAKERERLRGLAL
ncbi:MAG: flagellar biosynthetic protein FliO [Candidatus Hydrogenedentota bacterium]